LEFDGDEFTSSEDEIYGEDDDEYIDDEENNSEYDEDDYVRNDHGLNADDQYCTTEDESNVNRIGVRGGQLEWDSTSLDLNLKQNDLNKNSNRTAYSSNKKMTTSFVDSNQFVLK
jgi:hypothetical protein